MLGDDDGLMPGYVRRLRQLVERFREPEVIYQSAWLYAYPGVDPSQASGYLQPYGYAEFMRGMAEPLVSATRHDGGWWRRRWASGCDTASTCSSRRSATS